MNPKMFCSELELGNFLGTILDVIPYAFGAVSESSSTYKIHTSPGIKVLDFSCSLDHTTRFLNEEFDLVSSENHEVVDFISTKVNPVFWINKAAVEVFEHLGNEREELKNLVIDDSSLVITGQSLGGYLAILFTLWLHHVIDVNRKTGSTRIKRPTCITFGTPLVGDKALQSAISERPEWKSSFLSVVSTTDPFASFFSSKTRYKPFSTFLFCMQTGGHTAFKDQEAILAVLDMMQSLRTGKAIMHVMHDYKNDLSSIGSKNDLSSIGSKVLYRGVSEFGEEFKTNAFRVGVTLQFREIGVLDNNLHDLIDKIEGNHEKKKGVMETFSDEKKLSKRKMKMATMELFISSRKSKSGYYDRYKIGPINRDEFSGHHETVTNHGSLKQYWEEFVKDKELIPQKEEANLRKSWLYSGNNYRRMFEPIEIAKYYKDGNINYMDNRPKHYKLLENWWNEDKKDLNPSKRKSKGPNINDDSCFWAYVEEALISLRILMNGRSRSHNADQVEQKLDDFMTYMMHSINDYSLSPDTFLEGSSLMTWWSVYNAYKEGLCTSNFAQYMKSGMYKLYQ